jgi:hypothetical protein
MLSVKICVNLRREFFGVAKRRAPSHKRPERAVILMIIAMGH